jgi:hypothetical protein
MLFKSRLDKLWTDASISARHAINKELMNPIGGS